MINDESTISSKVFKEIKQLCCAAEIGTTLYIDYISIKKNFNLKQKHNF